MKPARRELGAMADGYGVRLGRAGRFERRHSDSISGTWHAKGSMGPASQSRWDDALDRLFVQPAQTLRRSRYLDLLTKTNLMIQPSQPRCRSHAGPGAGASSRVTVAWIRP